MKKQAAKLEQESFKEIEESFKNQNPNDNIEQVDDDEEEINF